MLLILSLLLPVWVGRIEYSPVKSNSQITWPSIQFVEVATQIPAPVAITHSGDGTGRLLITSRTGSVFVLQDGLLLDTPFLDIRSRVLSEGSEQGLLSVAIPPGFAQKGYFYVNYTRSPAGDTVVSRFRVSDADPNQADPDSEVVIFTISQPFRNHNGGQLAFGPDGYLYIGMGDGGGGGDPHQRAQDPGDLLGKLLRIDVEGDGCVSAPPGDPNYCIPSSNPFVDNPDVRDEIWALGLRNPWRFSFDRQTGDLFLADVGQGQMEEVDFQLAGSSGGENYGWDILEGTQCHEPDEVCTPPANYNPPVAVYRHDQGCSVTGGYIYRGSRFSSLQGIYFYSDFCSGNIWGLKNQDGWQSQLLASPGFSITTFGEDESGSLYIADYGNGTIYRIETAENEYFLPLIYQR